MNTVNQICVLLACMASGIASGSVFELNCLVCRFVKNRAARIAADVLFFALLGVLFVACCVVFRLPDFRPYMFLAALAGLLLYGKSLHRIVAFFSAKLYNSFRRACKAKAKRAASYNERGKIQENRRRRYGRGSYTVRHFARLYDLSTDRHFRAKEPHRGAATAVRRMV